MCGRIARYDEPERLARILDAEVDLICLLNGDQAGTWP
jgi:hypothetical protein